MDKPLRTFVNKANTRLKHCSTSWLILVLFLLSESARAGARADYYNERYNLPAGKSQRCSLPAGKLPNVLERSLQRRK